MILVFLLFLDLLAIPVFAASDDSEVSNETLGEISDEITEEYSEDVPSEDDTSVSEPLLGGDFITDSYLKLEGDLGFGGGETISPNYHVTNPYSNDCISITYTDIIMSVGEEYELRYLLKKPGYTLRIFYEGQHLFTYGVDDQYIVINAMYPGNSMMMVYYSKRDGNDILDEGHVMVNIHIEPKAGYALIKNMDSKRYMDVPNSKTTSGTKPILWSRKQTLSANQLWRIMPQGDGTTVIVSALCSYNINHFCLDRNTSTGYAQLNYNVMTKYIIQYNEVSGYYIIKPSVAPNLTLATADNGTANNTYLKFISNGSTNDTIEWDINYDLESLYGVSYNPPTILSITSPSFAESIKTYNTDINFSATVRPADTTATIKWKSSNSDILTIDETTGVAEAKKPGKVTVTLYNDLNNLKDEIEVDVYGKLNICVYYDESFAALCDANDIVDTEYIREIFAPVVEKYRIDYNIDITFNNPCSYTSSGDICENTTGYYSVCTCGEREDLPYYLYNLHKQLSSILELFTPTNPSTDLNLIFTGHYTELKNESGGKEGALGLSLESENKLVVTINPDMYRNCGYVSASCGRDLSNTLLFDSIVSVLAHEIGHHFGIDDHDKGPLATDQNDNCIWGLNKNEESVYANLAMCVSCQDVINSNGLRFNLDD